ncbi:MAG: hypothetical protein EHM24_31605, partial [Acidobacteria bacterium]
MPPTGSSLQFSPAQRRLIAPQAPAPSFTASMPVRAQRQQYQPKVPAARLVALADLAVVLLALAAVLVGGNLETMPAGLDEFLAMRVTLKNLLSLGAFIAGCALLFRLAGLYDAWRVRRWRHEATRAFIAVSGAATLAAIFPMVNPAGVFGASALSYLWVVALTLFLPWRAARSFLSRGPRERRQVLIVGAGPNALRIYRQLCADLTTACHVVGFVDNAAPSSPFVARRTLGSLDRLEEILAGAHVDEVRIGLPVKSHYARIQEVISVCERLGVKATYHADIFDSRI